MIDARSPRLVVPCTTLALALVALTLWCGGPRGIAYLVVYGLALLPGLPIGWRLFGRGPTGWVAGALVGYGLTALAFWVPIRLAWVGPLPFGIAWIVVTGAVWSVMARSRDPLVPLPPFTKRDAAAWLILLHLVLAFLAMPFGRIGETDAAGSRYYRAYFTADFVWHMALTRELRRFEFPPRNPYFAADPIHYYYTYFLVPAVLTGPEQAPIVPVETALEVTAIGSALLMFSLVFLAARCATGRTGPAAWASAIALVAPSFEGLYKAIDLVRHGAALETLRDVNIDAVTAWDFGGLRIDGLVRSMWYTPQHSISFALGLVAVVVASRFPERPRPLAFLLTGVALGLSVAMNPLLGAAFCAMYGATVVSDVAVRRLKPHVILQQALTVAPVALAIGWCLVNGMGGGPGLRTAFGWEWAAEHAPLVTLVLSLGGLLIPAIVGCLRWRTVPFRPVVPAVAGTVVGLGLLYLLTVSDRSWVAFRAGNILQVVLPMLAARGLAGLADSGRRSAASLLVAAVLVTGAPTTLIDTFNAQDITNHGMGPGLPWTITLTSAQQAGLTWIDRSTSPDTVVQADPLPRERGNWSIIPTFAGRRMAAGLPVSLLAEPDQISAPAQVHALMTSLPLDVAHEEARRLGIDYLWFDDDDAAAGNGARADRFLRRPDLFTPIFRQGEVAIYRVN